MWLRAEPAGAACRARPPRELAEYAVSVSTSLVDDVRRRIWSWVCTRPAIVSGAFFCCEGSVRQQDVRRMRPEISIWPVQQFYDGLVVDGPNVCAEKYGAAVLRLQVCSGLL